MADDSTLQALRDELAQQRQEERQENERKHQELVAELRGDGQPTITAAGARQTMSEGYAQTAAERAAKKAGEDQ